MGRNGGADLGHTERRRGGGVERGRSGVGGVAVAVAVTGAGGRQRNGHISLSREIGGNGNGLLVWLWLREKWKIEKGQVRIGGK